MEKILSTLSTEILVGFIGVLICGYVFLIKFFAPKVVKSIDKQWTDINKRLTNIETGLSQNNKMTLACLYNDLDGMLRKAEVTGIWSSQLSKQWKEMYNRYMDGGDGIDGIEGEDLKSRSHKIEVDDLKYAENVINYNKTKKAMIENI